MKSNQAILLSSLLSLTAAQASSALPPLISEIAKILPTSALGASPEYFSADPAAYATMAAHIHSIVAGNAGFFDTYSGAIPGFGGISAIVATAYNTALLTAEGTATSTMSAATSTMSSGSAPAVATTTSTTSVQTSLISSMTLSATSLAVSPTVTGSDFVSTVLPSAAITSSSSFGTLPIPTTPAPSNGTSPAPFTANAAATNFGIGLYGAIVAGIAGVAATL